MSLTPAEYSPKPKEVAVGEPALAAIEKERAVVALIERVRVPGVAYAQYFVGPDSAEEIVQSVSVRMLERWDSLTPEQRSARYFMKAVRNGVISQLRDEDRFVELNESLESLPDFPTVVIVSEDTARDDQLRWLHKMIKGMPLRRREVFVLVKEFGYTYDEAAEALGISVKTVDAQMQKAREYLERGAEHGGIRLTTETMRTLLPPPPKRLPPPPKRLPPPPPPRTEGSNDE